MPPMKFVLATDFPGISRTRAMPDAVPRARRKKTRRTPYLARAKKQISLLVDSDATPLPFIHELGLSLG